MHLLRVAVTVMIVLGVGVSAAVAKPMRGKPARWQTLPEPPAMPRPDVEGSAEVGGAKIYYAVYGKGEPVVLLHGGLGNSAHFGFQVPALVDKFQVITIDSRGQGRSTTDTAPITYDLMAGDVVAVLDKLALPRASVVGWSDGGEIALKLGILFPDRVDRLFVFGSNYDANGSKSRTGRSSTFSGYYLRCRRQYQELSSSGMSYKGLVEALRPLWHGPTGITKDQLRAIKAPVMMADGDHDEVIVLGQIQEMSRLIPNAQLTVFHSTSHFALWQDPETFNQALVGFLSKQADDHTSDHPGDPPLRTHSDAVMRR
ncbi:MAG TPA: alpha/beta hydrolase [Kofleriaceae bacterium]|nr:alpha/beta hydrolase [Kofleriaceae bacterium]